MLSNCRRIILGQCLILLADHWGNSPLLLLALILLTLNTRDYAYWLKEVAQNSKIGVMKANQSFCCGFCFEGSSRDELSTISYLTMKGCVVSACDFTRSYFRLRFFGEQCHRCDPKCTKACYTRLRLEVNQWCTTKRRSLPLQKLFESFEMRYHMPYLLHHPKIPLLRIGIKPNPK